MKYSFFQLFCFWLRPKSAILKKINTLHHVGKHDSNYYKLICHDRVLAKDIITEIERCYGKIAFVSDDMVQHIVSSHRSRRYHNNILFVQKDGRQYVRFVYFSELDWRKQPDPDEDMGGYYPIESTECICKDQKYGTAIFIKKK